MKLLLDENLSQRLVGLLEGDFPESTHMEFVLQRGDKDRNVWEYAKANGFTIVSKDNDFRQRVFLLGFPPKVVWLSVGNASTNRVAQLILSRKENLLAFEQDFEAGLLILRIDDVDE